MPAPISLPTTTWTALSANPATPSVPLVLALRSTFVLPVKPVPSNMWTAQSRTQSTVSTLVALQDTTTPQTRSVMTASLTAILVEALLSPTVLTACRATSCNPQPRPVSLLASVPYSPMLSLVPVILVIRLAPPVSPQPPTAMPVPPSTSPILVPFLLLAVLVILLVMNALEPETPIVKPVPPTITQLTNFLTSVWLPAQTTPTTSTSMELSVRSVRVSAALAPALSTPTVTLVLSTTTKL